MGASRVADEAALHGKGQGSRRGGKRDVFVGENESSRSSIAAAISTDIERRTVEDQLFCDEREQPGRKERRACRGRGAPSRCVIRQLCTHDLTFYKMEGNAGSR